MRLPIAAIDTVERCLEKEPVMSLLVLSCDAGESDGEYSIGVVVRQNPPKGNKPLQVVAYLSKKIDPEKSFGAEYRR